MTDVARPISHFNSRLFGNGSGSMGGNSDINPCSLACDSVSGADLIMGGCGMRIFFEAKTAQMTCSKAPTTNLRAVSVVEADGLTMT